ncbi:ankyrin repeat-containing protein [Achlya hypogyna]|uniref:Ankyrin repeat-containing protein n=1 Tax=Achlya hypogyna TaxID=1202772 RepID=A0A1V9ZLU5_ACHHY|nr:ankyrin repeat-containing protein [Achlya hypogyna]
MRVLLDAGAFVDQECNVGWTPLIVASIFGRADAVRLLLDARAAVNPGTRDHAIAINVAAMHGHRDVIQILLAAGADLDLAYFDGSTSLMTAVLRNFPGIVQDLLTAGADVNTRRATDGVTAFYLACAGGNNTIARILVEAGAKVSEPNGAGETPREVALTKGYADIVALIDAVSVSV